MKRNSLSNLAILAGAFSLMAVAPVAAYAQKQGDAAATQRDIYSFKRYKTPVRIEPYHSTAYTSDGRTVNTVRGDELVALGDSIIDFSVNPAGISFGVVTKGKKKNKAAIYSTVKSRPYNHIHSFNNKKVGNPSSIVFAPDARKVYLSTTLGILILEPRKFHPTDTITGTPFIAEDMVVSPNGYYLAGRNGSQVAIYNCQENTLRKVIEVGEKVNDMTFSPDNNDFAVLTDDGMLSIYSTRTFDVRKMVDNLGDARACAYNFDGKYMAVADSVNNVALVNVLNDTEREAYNEPLGGVYDVCFITDAGNATLMGNTGNKSVKVRRMPHLKPYYGKLIADEVDRRMEEWLKMMPGETMEEYALRVTDESRRRQRQLFEDEIATGYAPDMLGEMGMTLGSYDRANELLTLNFASMPSIYLPVPESDVTGFTDASDLSLSDVQYGILPDDTFEIVYAVITNRATGKEYVYDNHDRTTMAHVAEEDAISIELLQQQQMEEIKLQEIKEQVVEEAKSREVISDHTNIAVNSRLVPDVDANGNKILNYNVKFTYNVEPEFSAQEDFKPGKYHVEESGAASSMLSIVKQAFEGDFRQYLEQGKKIRVVLTGTADASPIRRPLPYDGSFGEVEDEPVYTNGQLGTLTVTTKSGIATNPQLALMRAFGVKDYLEKNVEGYKDLDTDYTYNVEVSESAGSEFRRITVDFTIVDAF